MGVEGKLHWQCSRGIARLRSSDGDLDDAEERSMMQVVNNRKDARRRMVVAAFVMAVVVIASIEPALAWHWR